MLTSEEAARFWPVYDRYQVEMDAIAKRVVTLVDEYITHFRDMSDEKALQLVTDYPRHRRRSREGSPDVPAGVHRPCPAAPWRASSLENKMDAVLRYEMPPTSR